MANDQFFEVTFRVLFGREQDTLPNMPGARLSQVQEYIVQWPVPPSQAMRAVAAASIRDWLQHFGYTVQAVRYSDPGPSVVPLIHPMPPVHPSGMWTAPPPPLVPPSPTAIDPFKLPPPPLTAPYWWDQTPPSSVCSGTPQGEITTLEAAKAPASSHQGIDPLAGGRHDVQTQLDLRDRQRRHWTPAEDSCLLHQGVDAAQAKTGRTRNACLQRRLVLQKVANTKPAV